MKKLLSLIFFLHLLQSFAQGEANVWYFGENAGLDFNSGSPVALTNGQLDTVEGCATISDTNGNLLFYTDGTNVWDKNHITMPNGSGLNGDPSSSQSAIIVPNPEDDNIYYIFTVEDRNGDGKGLQYSVVDISLNDVISKNTPLINDTAEKITAVKSADCDSYWVITYKEGRFYVFKVDGMSGVDGVNTTPIAGNDGFYKSDDERGYLKVSPDGTKIAIAHQGDAKLLIYDFDDASGIISNEVSIPLISPNNKPYGVEFSPSGNRLYCAASNDYWNNNDQSQNNIPTNHTSTLYQIDLENTDITSDAARTILDNRNLYRGALQLAPDGKIYRALSSTYYIGSSKLGVINKPEELGDLCDYKPNEIDLGGRKSTQGLPPFIASLLLPLEITSLENNNQIITNQTLKLCVGSDYTFNTEDLDGEPTYTWTHNNLVIPNNNASNLSLTNLQFSDEGIYELEVIIDECGLPITYKGKFEIEVYNVPVANQPLSISECDTNNDGFSTFNLANLKDVEVLGSQNASKFKILYFRNQTDADSNSNAIINPYTNSAAFSTDTIIARIHNIENPFCYDTKSFAIQVFELPKPATSISNLGKCDNSSIGTDTDNLIIFNLQEKELDILNGQTAANFTIEYFTDVNLNYIDKITNPSAFKNSTTIQPIYVKIFNTSNPNCVAFTNFNLEVYTLPTITSPVSLKQCDNDTDGFSPFNLNEVNNKISTNAANETFTYFNSYVGADTNNINDIIPTPTAYTNKTPTTDTVWARVENLNSCHRVSEINLIVSTTGIPATFQKIYYECDDYLDSTNDDRDGVSSFDFSDVTAEIETILSASGQQLIIIYYRNETDALAEINPILDPSNYRNTGYPSSQQIYIRVDSQLDNDCLAFGAHITLNIEALPVANTVTINKECDDDFDGFFPFDISLVEATVLNGQTNVTVTYFDQDNNPLISPLPNPFLTNSQTITIRVTNNSTNVTNGACFDEINLEFIVEKKPVANEVSNRIECDDDFDGLLSFDTSTIEITLLNGQTGMLVFYFDQNGNSLPSPLPNPFLTETQTITIRVENELYSNCTAETTFDFIVHPKPQFELDETAIYCTNLPPIKVRTYNPLGDYTYVWKDETEEIISTKLSAIISNAGLYNVIATSNEGCESLPHQIIIEASSIASLTQNNLTVVDDSDNNSITIATTNLGIGDYEFAIQKMDEFISNYQDEPYFENLVPGIYTLFIQDKNNCGIAQIDIPIIGFPKFFTPNGDGFNDTWKVLGVNENFYASSAIYIFDRFGKLITQINPKGNGWDGLFNGQHLPATDYWFSVELIDTNGNSRIRKGHFSLIRR